MAERPDLTPFITSLRNVFRTMLRIEVVAEPESEAGSRLPDPAGPPPGEGMRASVEFRGLVTGSATLSMPPEAARSAVQAFTGRAVVYGSADFRDAAGELVNMIAAGVAARIAGPRVTITMPVVRFGPEPDANGSAPRTVAILPFRSPAGAFTLEIALDGALGRAA